MFKKKTKRAQMWPSVTLKRVIVFKVTLVKYKDYVYSDRPAQGLRMGFPATIAVKLGS